MADTAVKSCEGAGLDLGQRLLQKGDESRQIPYYIAAIYAIQENKEEAYKWLQEAIDIGWRNYRLSSRNPLMEDLPNEERYKLMMAQVKGMIDQMRRRAEGD